MTRTSELFDRDLASLWHPFTQHGVWPTDEPLVIDRAEGVWLYDSDGRRYLDGYSSLWVTVHGHRVREIDDAIRAQLGRLDHSTFLGATHEPGIVLAEKLLATAPAGLTRVFYAGDGASAVEAAIKMAFQSHAQRGAVRPLYAHVAEGYHGDTLGAVSVGGIDLFHATYRPILLDTRMVSSPGVLKQGQSGADRASDVVDELRALLQREGDQVCAVVVEPMVQAAAGMLTHDPLFLRGVRALCDEFGALMVVDEVATGIGRTGRMWAIEHAGVSPDLLTCGKGLTGGVLPLSAVLATELVYESFLGTPASGRTFFHGHTYTGNPLCCAAAIANLDLIAARGTVGRAAEIGERLGEWLAPLSSHGGVKQVRRIGTMTGIEVVSVGERTGFEVCREARRGGVMIRPLGDVVVLMPPLAISDEDLRLLVDVTTAAVHAVAR
ncbi:MAG: adenosylmethionine--8-amino-7-oxononanoate transaminase [Candidatus Nanopelagicales bacterium]